VVHCVCMNSHYNRAAQVITHVTANSKWFHTTNASCSNFLNVTKTDPI